MIAIDKSKKLKVQTRKIHVATYMIDSDNIVVEGSLKDEWMLKSYRFSGETLPPGIIHHMIVRMQVKLPGMVIEDIDVEMPGTPHESCIETIECLDPLKGMTVTSGFTSKVKRLVGGVKGCCHLLSLVTAMAPAVFQGAFSVMARKPIDMEVQGPAAIEKMKDTCWVWREDGPLIKRFS